jgi:fumarate reductase flavoprotein subunit
MGGILVDGFCRPLPGLLRRRRMFQRRHPRRQPAGSNSLSELLVFGKVAGVEAAQFREVGVPAGNVRAC